MRSLSLRRAKGKLAKLLRLALSRSSDLRARKLSILLDPKGPYAKLALTPQFYCPTEEGELPPGSYIVMLKGHNDELMVKAGVEMGMPRGFVLLVNMETEEVDFRGFRAKFSNDDIQQTDFDQSEIRETLTRDPSVVITLKMSGFLGMCFVVKDLAGELRYIVTSKNSCGITSDFAARFEELLAPHLTDELGAVIFERKMTLCAEVMSATDQTHGARVHEPNFCVTTLSFGGDESAFVEYAPHADMEAFCEEFGLPHTKSYKVEGMDRCLEVFGAINRDRDMMTLRRLLEIMGDEDVEGNLHMRTLGDVLEGLVLFFGDGSVLKFKFANYTFRTFGLRAVMGTATGMSNYVRFTEHFDNYTSKWVVSQAGKRFWHAKAAVAFMMYSTQSREMFKDDLVAPHILLAEAAMESEMTADEAVTRIEEKNRDRPRVYVVIVIGPVGSGKSSFAESLCEESKEDGRFFHIDGDKLPGVEDETSALGPERNMATVSAIIDCILVRKMIPVISTGGGALWTGRRPRPLSVVLESCIPDVDFRYVVSCAEEVDEAVLRRNWAMKEEMGEITALECLRVSNRNKKFEKMVQREMGNVTKQFPVITPETYETRKEVYASARTAVEIEVFDMEPEEWEEKVASLPTYFFQRRLVVFVRHDSVRGARHITLDYSTKQMIRYNPTPAFPRGTELMGTLVTLASGIVLVVMDVVPGLGVHSHVTLSSGPYDAGEMKKLAPLLRDEGVDRVMWGKDDMREEVVLDRERVVCVTGVTVHG